MAEEIKRDTDVVLYHQEEEHGMLFLPEDATFEERASALAVYTKIKGGVTESIDTYLNTSLRMVGIFQHRIKPRSARIDERTGVVTKPSKNGWVRTVVIVEGLEKPISFGSEPVAETAQDIIAVMGKQGMFPPGKSLPFHIEPRGKRPDQYYVLIVEED